MCGEQNKPIVLQKFQIPCHLSISPSCRSTSRDLLISVSSGCSSDSLVPRWLLVKQYKEVGVLGLVLVSSCCGALC